MNDIVELSHIGLDGKNSLSHSHIEASRRQVAVANVTKPQYVCQSHGLYKLSVSTFFTEKHLYIYIF